MHLIVTTPKREIETSNMELAEVQKNGGYFFRVFRFKPKSQVGQRVYEIENGFIIGYGIIIEISQIDDSMQCSTTCRIWGEVGNWIVKYDCWRNLKNQVKMRCIQGIRYTEEFYN